MSSKNHNEPVIAPPTVVRAIGAALFGLAVGIMAAPLAPGFQVIVLVATVGAALLLTFSHPYRRQVREEVEKRGERYRTSASQVAPLFPLWIALMAIPLLNTRSWALMAIAWVIAGAYTWFVYPQIDGTAHIKPIGTAKKKR
ncbi:hypothetical protein [uncultured Corynebacterium sp.]|uniref:hypothetical protein n=1 Tax=uncultured Corynebacterium sp. TaxID=159447 RepID=UPI0025D65D58|nr:hypothetical protein [uncultured Corynebacterium sp.]